MDAVRDFNSLVLPGDIPDIAMPADFTRSPVKSWRGNIVLRNLGADVAAPLKECPKRKGMRYIVVCLAAFKVLVSHYADAEDFHVTAPLALGDAGRQLRLEQKPHLHGLLPAGDAEGLPGMVARIEAPAPLLCPHCQHEMRIIALIHEAGVIERILRHLGLWEAGVRVDAARDRPEPAGPIIEPWLGDPFPGYDHDPVFAQNGEPRQRQGAP